MEIVENGRVNSRLHLLHECFVDPKESTRNIHTL